MPWFKYGYFVRLSDVNVTGEGQSTGHPKIKRASQLSGNPKNT